MGCRGPGGDRERFFRYSGKPFLDTGDRSSAHVRSQREHPLVLDSVLMLERKTSILSDEFLDLLKLINIRSAATARRG